jgi:hypothetical protein
MTSDPICWYSIHQPLRHLLQCRRDDRDGSGPAVRVASADRPLLLQLQASYRVAANYGSVPKPTLHDARKHRSDEGVMPRRSKGPHLWLRPGRRDSSGRHLRRPTWIILDGDNYVATGCLANQVAAAQIKLSSYIAEKYQPDRCERDTEDIDIAAVDLRQRPRPGSGSSR